jgi:transcriptional regulator with XRE-family HTH domain
MAMAFDRPGFDKEVGLLLQLARKRREITQAELAKQIGLPRASYANLESGRQRIPVDILWRAAVVLNVSISSLVPEPMNRRSARDVIFPAVENLSREQVVAATISTPVTATTLMYGTSTSSIPMVLYDSALPEWPNATATAPVHLLDKEDG